MNIIKVKNYKELSKKAADILINEILNKQKVNICFAAGESPLGLYKNLVLVYKKKKIDFSKIKAFNVDEYYPIKRKNKNSFYYYLFHNLFNHVNIKKSNIALLNGETKNPDKECRNYENLIRKYPIDLCILGVGINGHIGFNEPGSSFNSRTRVVHLSQKTIKRNSRFFKNKNQVPKKALTLGIKTILSSKKILLLASDKDKKEAIRYLIKGPINKKWPVSTLRKHKNVVVIVDEEALR